MVYAADWITHVATGGILGMLLPSSPWMILVGLCLGFLSHWILDEYFLEFSPFPLSKFWWWIAAQGAFAVYLVYSTDFTVIFWTILGSILPDIIDGIYAGINPVAWHKGELLIWFHRSKEQQREDLSFKTNIFFAITFAITYLYVKYKNDRR